MLETIIEEKFMTDDSTIALEVAPAEDFESENHIPSELVEPIWSVVTYETVAASGLTYEEAEKLSERLRAERVSGLCIITDEAASRISG